MSRLFVTDRELRLIADVSRELFKDVNGQRIVYYAISTDKTKTHDVYGEATSKSFENPILLEALVDARYHEDTKIDEFGVDNQYSLEVFLHWRDMVEKGVDVNIGDYFSFGTVMYEITDRQFIQTIYGQAEHKTGLKIIGKRARQSQFDAPLVGPTDISRSDEDAVQHEFYQMRGRDENAEGETGDVRELVRDGVLDKSLTGPHEVSEKGEGSGKVSSFYGDE